VPFNIANLAAGIGRCHHRIRLSFAPGPSHSRSHRRPQRTASPAPTTRSNTATTMMSQNVGIA
jgi:hypothetical protein